MSVCVGVKNWEEEVGEGGGGGEHGGKSILNDQSSTPVHNDAGSTSTRRK